MAHFFTNNGKNYEAGLEAFFIALTPSRFAPPILMNQHQCDQIGRFIGLWVTF